MFDQFCVSVSQQSLIPDNVNQTHFTVNQNRTLRIKNLTASLVPKTTPQNRFGAKIALLRSIRNNAIEI